MRSPGGHVHKFIDASSCHATSFFLVEDGRHDLTRGARWVLLQVVGTDPEPSKPPAGQPLSTLVGFAPPTPHDVPPAPPSSGWGDVSASGSGGPPEPSGGPGGSSGGGPPAPGQLGIREKRSWKTWQLLAFGVVMLVVGLYIESATTSTAAKSLDRCRRQLSVHHSPAFGFVAPPRRFRLLLRQRQSRQSRRIRPRRRRWAALPLRRRRHRLRPGPPWCSSPARSHKETGPALRSR